MDYWIFVLIILLLKLLIVFYHLVPLQKQGKTACFFFFSNFPLFCQRKPDKACQRKPIWGSYFAFWGLEAVFEPFVQLMKKKALLVFSLGTPKDPRFFLIHWWQYFPSSHWFRRSKELNLGLSGGTSGKESACQCKTRKRHGFDPWVGKIPWSRKWQPTQIFLPEKFQGQRSLAGYSPRGCKELETTEHAHTQRTELRGTGKPEAMRFPAWWIHLYGWAKVSNLQLFCFVFPYHIFRKYSSFSFYTFFIIYFLYSLLKSHIYSIICCCHSHPTLCDPGHCSTSCFPVLHHLPSLLKLMSIERVMPSNHLILCHPLVLPPSIFPSIKVFSNELTLCIR